MGEFWNKVRRQFQRTSKSELTREEVGVLRQTAFQLWLFNVAMGMLVTGSQLQFVPEGGGFKIWVYATLALISTVALLSVPLGLFNLLNVRLLARLGLLRVFQGSSWTLFLVLLFVDKSIYNLFRYHFSSQVWDLFYTRGSEDSVHLGWQVWSAILTGWVLATGVQVLVWNRFLVRSRRDPEDLPHLLLRPGIVWCGVIVSAFFLEKAIYATADVTRDKEVTELAKIFPLYPRLPYSEWAAEMGVDVPDRAERWTFESPELDYPKAMPNIDPKGPRPNILIVTIDCLRADMLNPTNTPGLAAYAEDARVFTDHISTGNQTRFGVFGMLYGLYGPYWFPVLREQRSPVLVDTLLELDYDMQIYSSASQNYPQLRSTAWSRIQDNVHDEFGPEEPWVRDEMSVEACIDWWKDRQAVGDERPFFSLLLLDSPHQKYSHPPEVEPFQPSAPDLNYLSMSWGGEGPDENERVAIRNRYLNAVYHADKVATHLLDTLAELGLDDNTIVVVTGDHGEEFWETGLFGHTSSFSPEQVRVPMVLRGPGIEAGVETTPTSHLDLPATLLELLGADPSQRGQWTLGDTLLTSHSPNRHRVVSGWDKLGLWVPDAILEVPMVGELTSFDILAYTYDWQLILADDEMVQRYDRSLRRIAEGCNRFRALSKNGESIPANVGL
jgi:uncharacterized protein